MLTNWARLPIDPLNDPWYRFGRVVNILNERIQVPKSAKWLDVGCQMGQFLKVLQSFYSIEAHGVDDYSQNDAIEVCKRHLNIDVEDAEYIFDGTWRYHQRRIEAQGIALHEKFDFVSALEVIEHFVDTDQFIYQCSKHLKAGGILVITTPNINSLRNRVLVPLGRYPASMEYRNVIHHVRIYNAPMLIDQMTSHQFRLIALEGVSFLPRKLICSSIIKHVDRMLARAMPTFCGQIIAIFQKVD